MKRIDVACPARSSQSYQITVGRGALAELAGLSRAKDYSKCCVVLDGGIEGSWRSRVEGALQAVKPAVVSAAGGETCKSEAGLAKLWTAFQAQKLDRRSLVINVGGGALCDLGGFAAATFMRGLDFVNVPTTLLAQVDASIGGKLAVNFGAVKNLVGLFGQPRAVVADTEFLTTLPRRELCSGMAEVVKHGLIKDKSYLALAERGIGEAIDHTWFEEVVSGSCRIKGAVVEADENETGPRKTLNFGHTLGHAIELLSHDTQNPLLHGEAVSIGMAGEAYLSKLAGNISAGDLSYIEGVLKKCALPVRLPAGLKREAILEKTRTDKKNVGGRTKWTLLKSLGAAVYDVELEDAAALEAIGYIADV